MKAEMRGTASGAWDARGTPCRSRRCETRRCRASADCGIDRVSAAAQDARRNLVEIAERFKEQDAQDAHGGAFDHSGLRRKKRREKVAEQDDRGDRNYTAYRRQQQAQPQDALTPVTLPCSVVLARKNCLRLAERRDDVVGEAFKVHRDRASCDHSLAEAVDRRLHKEIGKAEHRSLHGRGNAGLQDVFRIF